MARRNFWQSWPIGVPNYEEKSLAYDLNGNINRLVRTNSTGGSMADYTYHYKGNQLNQINALTGYTYDKNGNATLDGLRGFTIAYNSLNLPKSITSGTDNIAYIYSAAGTKLAKKMKDNTYHYYAGNMMYNTDKSLNYLLFEEGMVNKGTSAYAYEYHIKDHLGNTRVAFQPNGSSTTLTQVAEYYPFGSTYLPIYNAAGTSNKYLYNGKEKQDDVLGTGSTALDWYDYGARFYDPQIGRWISLDPLATKYYSFSSYCYVADNPIKYIDPDGKKIVDTKGNVVNVSYNKDGSLSFSKNVTASIVRIANALNLTETGKAQLKNVDQSDVHVKMNITPEAKIEKQSDGTHYTYGETEQGNKNTPPTYGQYVNKDGTMGIKEATITIYEGTITEDASRNDAKAKHAGLTTEQAIGAVAGHEIVHATDKTEINKDLQETQGKPREDDREAKPEQVEKKIINESRNY